MKRLLWVFILSLVCTTSAGVGRAQSSQHAISVSMLQLLTTPERFGGQLISVIGFVAIDPEGDLLFAHQEDELNQILGNAIRLKGTKQMFADREKLDGKYVKILGTFELGDRRRVPFYSGTIVEIRSCDFWSDPAHPMSQRLKETAPIGAARP